MGNVSTKKPRIIASIEARMASSRLPGKVLIDINGKALIGRIVQRLKRCPSLDGIVLATTTNPNDDPIASWAAANDVTCFRGNEDDVLLRVVEAQRMMDSEIAVEICGDTPLLDPEVLEFGIQTFLNNDCDLVSNTWKLSYPMGVDVQVFPLRLLEEVAATIKEPEVREHVSLYFYQHPERYRILHLLAPQRWHAPGFRFQVDYQEDLAFVREVYRRLAPEHGDDFGLEEIMRLLREEPSLGELNRNCEETHIEGRHVV
ncbi:MAG: hypothetical protein A2X49_03530 [Lentisphaerae bacterium GWF2_52_8]|nr:MAG: hypothetical protein A2X49_03530 [Lentisphaerae bacterium GWF2_52_8]